MSLNKRLSLALWESPPRETVKLTFVRLASEAGLLAFLSLLLHLLVVVVVVVILRGRLLLAPRISFLFPQGNLTGPSSLWGLNGLMGADGLIDWSGLNGWMMMVYMGTW